MLCYSDFILSNCRLKNLVQVSTNTRKFEAFDTRYLRGLVCQHYSVRGRLSPRQSRAIYPSPLRSERCVISRESRLACSHPSSIMVGPPIPSSSWLPPQEERIPIPTWDGTFMSAGKRSKTAPCMVLAVFLRSGVRSLVADFSAGTKTQKMTPSLQPSNRPLMLQLHASSTPP